jgi:8-oxo-dGTP pyrophosphatase MutT (NUDIX family)
VVRRKSKNPKNWGGPDDVDAVARPDSPEETGVLVDEADRVIGAASRRDIRARNLLHRGIAVVVRNPAGQIYVHRRTRDKDVFPDMYDTVVGGMVTAGESYDQAARRELAEELGIEGVEPRFVLRHRYRGEKNNAWISLYQVVWPGAIRHQEAEIAWGSYMAEGEILARRGEWQFAPDHLEAFDRYLSVQAPEASG